MTLSIILGSGLPPCYADFCCANGVLNVFILSVVMLTIFVLSVVLLSVALLSIILMRVTVLMC
jgi:hypothetical protein